MTTGTGAAAELGIGAALAAMGVAGGWTGALVTGVGGKGPRPADVALAGCTAIAPAVTAPPEAVAGPAFEEHAHSAQQVAASAQPNVLVMNDVLSMGRTRDCAPALVCNGLINVRSPAYPFGTRTSRSAGLQMRVSDLQLTAAALMRQAASEVPQRLPALRSRSAPAQRLRR